MKRVKSRDITPANTAELKRLGEFRLNNTQVTGEYSAREGVLTFYSYNMPMLWAFDDGLVLSNPNPYSVTTSKHLGEVRGFERNCEMLVLSENGLLMLSHPDEDVIARALLNPAKSHVVNKLDGRQGPVPKLAKRLEDVVGRRLHRYGVRSPLMQLLADDVAGELMMPEAGCKNVVQLTASPSYRYSFGWRGRAVTVSSRSVSEAAFGSLLGCADMREVVGRLHGRSPAGMGRERALKYEHAFRDLRSLLLIGASADEAKALIRSSL